MCPRYNEADEQSEYPSPKFDVRLPTEAWLQTASTHSENLLHFLEGSLTSAHTGKMDMGEAGPQTYLYGNYEQPFDENVFYCDYLFQYNNNNIPSALLYQHIC